MPHISIQPQPGKWCARGLVCALPARQTQICAEMGSLFPCHVGCTPQAALADPQYIQELEQHLQQHQSDVISMDQQVEFAASQGLCTLPYHCTMPWECLCSWHDCSVIMLPAGEHMCTVQLHIHCLPAKHDFDSAGPLLAMEGHTSILGKSKPAICSLPEQHLVQGATQGYYQPSMKLRVKCMD